MVISKVNTGREHALKVMFPGPCHQPLFWLFHLWWRWVMLRVSPGQHTACVVWFMDRYFREAAIFFFILKKALKTYKSWENIICLLKTRFMNRCIYLFCHHTDGQKMFSCHGSEMYSITDEKEIYIKKVLSCQLLYHGGSCWIWVLLSWNFNSKPSRPHFSSAAISASCNLPAICL